MIKRWNSSYSHQLQTPLMVANPNGEYVTHSDHLEAIKQAVLKEREECAKVCEVEGSGGVSVDKHLACHDCADAIRSRKEGQ